MAVCIGLCTVAAAPEAFGSLFVWCILFKYWKTLCRWYLLLLYYCSGLFILHFLYKAIASTRDALFRPEQPSCPLYKPPVFLPHAPVAECNDGTETPELFLDNIFTLEVMEEPVIATDGFTYEKRCIMEWFKTKRSSPTTGAALLSADLIPNHSLKSQINQWREKMVRQSLVFSLVADEHLPSGPRPCCSCFVASPGTSASTSRPRRYTDTICISRLRDSSSNARRNLFTGDCGQGGRRCPCIRHFRIPSGVCRRSRSFCQPRQHKSRALCC